MGKPGVLSLRGCVCTVLFLLASCATPPTVQAPNPADSPKPAPAVEIKPRIALVLGGGGVKGFAHVGVIKVLEAHGIKPDIVVGTSAGSFVGSLYASGMSVFDLQKVALSLQESDIRDLTLSTQGFLVGEKLQKFVNEQVKLKPIHQFPIQFVAVATDLASGEKVAFNYGNAGQAVRASCAIPNVFLPAEIGGRKYVDGGLVSPVPVKTAKDFGADIVIAVDISAKPKQSTGNMGFWALLDQSINILSMQALKAELAMADVVIQPSVQHADALKLDQRHEFLLEGEQTTQKQIETIKAKIQAFKTRPVRPS